MEWIKHFDLFLFDFDGLLVNTEKVHFQAYINMCAARRVHLKWNFLEYCSTAHRNNEAMEQTLRMQYPELFQENISWKTLYEEKKRHYQKLLQSTQLELMNGVEDLLKALQKEKIPRCVVTHSVKEQVDLIRLSLPILNTIEHWITKDMYINPKPDPECYLQAIKKYGKKANRIIGFEDSLRGLKALLQTPALSVLICPQDHPHLQTIGLMKGVLYYPSFSSIEDRDFG